MTAAKGTAAKPKAKRRDVSLPKFKQKRAAGRPMLYEAEAHCARATKLAMLGLNDAEIAFQFGVSNETFYAWQAAHPEFSEALGAGKVEADADVVQSLFKRATGRVKIPATKIFLRAEDDAPVYAPYVETPAPDTNAIKLWLLNRQPGKWRERREIDVSGTLEHRISAMDPEQRLERLRELQQRAAQIIIDAESVEIEGDAE